MQALRRLQHGVAAGSWASSAARLSRRPVTQRNVSSETGKDEYDEWAAELEALEQEFDASDPFRGFKKQGQSARANTDLVQERTHFQRQDTDKPALQLPPFLRRRAFYKKTSVRGKKPVRAHEDLLSAFDVPEEKPFGRRKGLESAKKKLSESPFSTRFAHNPWARALATPVRECRTTATRLPTGCLVDFHTAETLEDEQQDAPAVDQSFRPETNGDKASASIRSVQSASVTTVELMPMTLARDLIPTSSRAKAEQWQLLSRLSRQASLRRKPHGMASYLASHYSVVDSIAQNMPSSSKKRSDYIKRSAAGRMLGNALTKKFPNGATLDWRGDMADVVLKGLRANVIKRLRYWVMRKSVKTAEATLTEVIGGGMSDDLDAHGGLKGWRGVEAVDDVVCVLRLRPETLSASGSSTPLINDTGIDEVSNDVEVTVEAETASRSAEQGSKASSMLEEDPSKITTAHSTEHKPLKLMEEQSQDSTIEAQSSTDDSTPGQTRSTTFIDKKSAYENSAHTPAFLLDLMPLLPDRRPSSMYFPTLPYRGRRIPVYDLYYLLGPSLVEGLLSESVFADSRYLALKGSLATVGLAGMLSRLMSYVATSKAQFAQAMEEQSRVFSETKLKGP